MRTVIFDLDGTLADTSGDLIDAANACFTHMGVGPLLKYGADSGTAMRGGKAMLRLGLERLNRAGDEDEIDGLYPILLKAYSRQLDKHSFMFDGAMDAVEELKSRDYRVGVCTNKPEAMAQELLTRLGVRAQFGSLVGADTLAVRKPHPQPLIEAVTRAGGDPKRCTLIGDTVTDRETARALGVPSILVTFGPDGKAVADLQPEGMIDHFHELPDLVQSLIG
jgi:phosphoglycolate phosphatase